MSTKELNKIPGLPEEEVVVIKKLGFGSLNMLRSKSTVSNINVKTNEIEASVDLGKYMKWMLVYGIKSAKFFDGKTFDARAQIIDMDVISATTGEYLYKKIQEFNGFEEAETLKKN